MTIKKALIAAIALPDISPDELEKAAIDNRLSLDADYSADLKKQVDIAAISVLKGRIHLASFGEGGVSYSFNAEALKQRIIDLANQNGLTQVVADFSNKPKIRPIRFKRIRC